MGAYVRKWGTQPFLRCQDKTLLLTTTTLEDWQAGKLTEMLSDPDKGRSLRATVERRLRRSLQASRRGERGVPAREVAKRYGLKW